MKKKNIFISSTFDDLQNHRRAIWELLEKMPGVLVRGMERFGARPETPLDTCLTELASCDVYAGIIGFRFGSIDDKTGKSFTQIEYEKAKELDKQILIYEMDPKNSLVCPEHFDRGVEAEKLEAFKKLLRKSHTVYMFSLKEDLVNRLKRDLERILTIQDQTHISQQDDFSNSKKILDHFRLVPKTYSGRDVRLLLSITSDPFPASQEICACLNLEFGSTVGIPIKIVQPEGFDDFGLDTLYAAGNWVDSGIPLTKGNELDVYAKLEFIPNKVDRKKARYKEAKFLSCKITEKMNFMREEILGADCMVILILTQIVSTG